jgi:hypothetical protein
MQQPGEKIRHLTRNRPKQSIKYPHLSTFGILNRNGLEIPEDINLTPTEEGDETKPSFFARASMPEQPSGYIKCKKHDFL